MTALQKAPAHDEGENRTETDRRSPKHGTKKPAIADFWQNGAPGTIRTCDPLVRSQVLYPAELRVRKPCPARLDEGRVL